MYDRMVHRFPVMLLPCFVLLFVGLAQCEDNEVKNQKSETGCLIQAHYVKGKKLWLVRGHWKAPNVERQGKVLGTRFKTLVKASKECDKWMREKIQLLPLTISPVQKEAELVAERRE